MTQPHHHIYLIPGMFGFGRLAGYDYFEHVQRALAQRFARVGVDARITVVSTPPTASIRRRARVLATTIEASHEDGSPIHLVGHSTGGLDARLLASPSANLALPPEQLRFSRNIASVVTMNTPHHGTPLAHFFTTVSGTRLLYALSLLTFTTLRYGSPPLTVFSSLVASLGNFDEAIGVDIGLLDRTTDLLLRFVGDQGRSEVHDWLDGIRQDQGGIVQITPEAMDLFNATTANAPDVRYGSIATAAPPPAPVRFVMRIRTPYAALSATAYSTLHTVTARAHRRYPAPPLSVGDCAMMTEAIGKEPTDPMNDGVVPTLSMVWGELLWTGKGDHLDVVGHFQDDVLPARHYDWLTSGAHFNRLSFAAAMDRLSSFLLGD